MKTALLVGCGSKFGLRMLKELLDNNWVIYSIAGSEILPHENLHQLIVNWSTCNQATIEKFLNGLPELDLVFFNQNSTSLTDTSFKSLSKLDALKLEKHWVQSYFISCILPYHIIQNTKLSASTKVIWMLSSYIYFHAEIRYADYLGDKFQNYIIMKNFSQTERACFMGINPGNLDNEINLKNILNLLEKPSLELNGKVMYVDGIEDKNFDKFTNKSI